MTLQLRRTLVMVAIATVLLPQIATVQAADEPEILTPPPAPQPRINGAKVFGVRPGNPLLYTIAATGRRPMKFSIANLPDGLQVDQETGQITGSLARRGTYRVTLRAENALGHAERELRIVVGDELLLTPLLGCNTWGGWGSKVTDANLRAAAKAMVDTGLINHGWQYVNIDDGWQGHRGGPYKAIQPNEKFPDMKALCDYIHGLGLKAGIYSTPWTTSYSGFVGGSSDDPQGAWEPPKRRRDGYRCGKFLFETNDARQWAAWGFDYAKYDWDVDSVELTRRMADALAACNRDIVLELSNSVPLDKAAEHTSLAHLSRTTGDLVDFWDRSQMPPEIRGWAEGLREVWLAHDAWAPYQKPGHWNHACNIRVGLLGGWRNKPLTPTHLTPDEQYTHISLWCLWGSPMIIGTPIERLDPFTLSLLSNDEVLEINQDPLGVQGRRAKASGGEAVVKPLEDGSKAVGLLNPGTEPAKVTIDWPALGLKGEQQVRDLWRQKDLGVHSEKFTAEVRPHGVVLVRLTPATAPENDSAGRWSAERANAWYDSQPWPIGCNYIPSTAINQLETWQDAIFLPPSQTRFSPPGDKRMVTRSLPFLLLLLMPPMIGQTSEQNPDTGNSSMLSSFLAAGMPEEILFAVRKPSIDGHWYANIAYYSTDQCRTTFPMNSGGKLCIYNVRTKKVRTIFEDPEGNIRDPQIHYDAKKLVFAYLPKGKRHYSLYEINLDGTGLTQLTGQGEDVSPGMEDYSTYSPPGWDDFEPTYLPDDKIIFCSTRANRYVQCWMTQVGTLHKCDANGSNLHMLSANVEHDNTPWVLSNGQVAYMRWEYVDRFHMGYHHLWSMNPDGTRQMVLYGNQINHGTILAVKPVPDSPKIVVTWSPGHGRREHYGRVALIDPRMGPDDPDGVQYISKGHIHCDPWAFNESQFLVANKSTIELLDDRGETEVLHRLPEKLAEQGYWIGEPRPVMRRKREPVFPDRVDPSTDHGALALVNIYKGRKMGSLRRGTIKNLLVYEVLPAPINYAGAMSEMSAGGTFSVERLIGSVPVSEHGSAYFKLPAVRSFLFLAMDEKGHCVKRMHSFTSVMPGETTTCIGCHETRTETPSADERRQLADVMRGRPGHPEPVVGVPEIFDFLRDIQPILDQHCLECHNHDREEGGFNISGHWGPLYPIGYIQMSWRQLFGDNRIILPYSEHSKSNFDPYEIGTGSSRLLKLIEEGHEGVNMPEREQKVIRHWLDAGANHAGTYAVNSHGTIGYYLHSVNVRNDKDWPETQAMVEVMNRRCDGCHAPTEAEKEIGTYKLPAHFYARYYPPDEFQKNRYLAHTMSEDGGRFNRHLIYNLSYPELSKAARAPLAKEAGGLGVCEAKPGETVFRDRNDPDYRAIVAAVARGRKHILEENNRFCMINPSPNNGENCPVRYVPRRDYVREMIRYGVLPVDHDFEASVDPFELDEAYWKTFWYTPTSRRKW